MSNYFSQWPELRFVRRDGETVLARDALAGKDYILLYFGAAWSPDCRHFTPLLADFYRDHHVEKNFEVVYLCRERDEYKMHSDFFGDKRVAAKREAEVQPTAEKTAEASDAATGPAASPPTTAAHSSPPSVSSPSPSPSLHGDYLAVQYADLETVAVPLLFHFRVFTYPAVLVCANPPPSASPSPSTPLPSVIPAAVEKDRFGRPRFSPRITNKAYVPQVVSITGRFMIERGDPSGANFPWTTMDDETRGHRNRFFAVVGAVLLVVVALLWQNFTFLFASPPQRGGGGGKHVKRVRGRKL